MIKRFVSFISTFFSPKVYPLQAQREYTHIPCTVLSEEPKKKRRPTTRMRVVKPKESMPKEPQQLST